MSTKKISNRDASAYQSQINRASAARPLQFFDKGQPYLKDIEIKGRLIVLEGADGSGRSTQIGMLTTQLEAEGHAVISTGLRRSEFIGQGIVEAKKNLALTRRTLSLFYAADIADQIERKVIPSLRAGYIVLSDRYVYTLMARNSVRGLNRRWSHNLFEFAIKPDLVFYLMVDPYNLIQRHFYKNTFLDYYESGADLGLSENMFDSFIRYQKLMAEEFRKMQTAYNLVPIDGNRSIEDVNSDLLEKINNYLKSSLI
jgi:dTMP kinase